MRTLLNFSMPLHADGSRGHMRYTCVDDATYFMRCVEVEVRLSRSHFGTRLRWCWFVLDFKINA